MLFSFLFTAATLDALVNGPKLVGPRPYAVATVSILALLFQDPIGFLIAEAILFAFFLEAAFLERKTRKEAKLKAAEAPSVQAVEDNILPEKAQIFLREAKDLFVKNVGGDQNAFGQPWKVLASDGAVNVSQSDYPGQKCKWFKVEGVISGELQTIKREIMDYESRCKWDSGLQSGKILKTFQKIDAGEPYLALFYTAPAAGGMVSSREILDLGLLVESNGGFDYINCSLPKDIKLKEMPTKVIGERAFTHKGSGMRVQPIPGTNKYNYVLVSALDLGGWLPASVVNSATSGALLDGTKAMIAQLEKVAQGK